TKGQAVRAFLDYPYNTDAYERASGWHAPFESAAWDPVNEHYGLRGKRRVRSLGDAVAAVIPGRPYCLDRMDLETLNETPAAQEVGGFLPTEKAIAEDYAAQEAAYYEELQQATPAGTADVDVYVDEDGALYVEADVGVEVPF